MTHEISHRTDMDFSFLEQCFEAVSAGILESKTQFQTIESRALSTRKYRVQTSVPQRRGYASHCWKCATSISSNACNRCSRCQFYQCPNCKTCLCGKVHKVVSRNLQEKFL